MSALLATDVEKIELKLTVAEEVLVCFLLKAMEYAGCNDTTARIAGGWVRDKLLDLSNDDIDIALDNLSGECFAQLLNNYLDHLKLPVRTIGVIQANPNQSKHLETANIHLDLNAFYDMVRRGDLAADMVRRGDLAADMVVNDDIDDMKLENVSNECTMDSVVTLPAYDLDCVNLRTETYTHDSRIPSIRIGTPLEDALRRDFTMNALFYNIHTRKIEDFTGHGFGDLKSGLIRTPLPSAVTFHDDPLRILRSIRFAARFDYKLYRELICSIQQTAIRNALLYKISRERIFKEVEGMLSGKFCRPLLATWMIAKLNLYPLIWKIPIQTDNNIGMNQTGQAGQTGLGHGNAVVTSIASSVNNVLEFVPINSLIEKSANWQNISIFTMYWVHILLGLGRECADKVTPTLNDSPFSLAYVVPGLVHATDSNPNLNLVPRDVIPSMEEYYRVHHSQVTNAIQQVQTSENHACSIPHSKILNMTELGDKRTRLLYWASSLFGLKEYKATVEYVQLPTVSSAIQENNTSADKKNHASSNEIPLQATKKSKKGSDKPTRNKTNPNSNNEVLLIDVLLKESLKMDLDTTKLTHLLFENYQEFQAFASELHGVHSNAYISSNSNSIPDANTNSIHCRYHQLRIDMGINLRNKTKEYWRACLFFACAVECMLFCHNHGLESKLMNLEPAIPLLAIGSGVPVICDDSAADTVCELDYSGLYNSYINKKELNDIITKYSVLEYTVINVFRLNLIWKMKPIFDGHQLCQLLGVKRGPQVGIMIEHQSVFLIQSYPYFSESNCLYSESDKANCLEYIKSRML